MWLTVPGTLGSWPSDQVVHSCDRWREQLGTCPGRGCVYNWDTDLQRCVSQHLFLIGDFSHDDEKKLLLQ